MTQPTTLLTPLESEILEYGISITEEGHTEITGYGHFAGPNISNFTTAKEFLWSLEAQISFHMAQHLDSNIQDAELDFAFHEGWSYVRYILDKFYS